MSRTLLITGVTRGIGRGLAEAAVAAGHTVLGCGRDRAMLRGLSSRFGAPHRFDAVDVAVDGEVAAWAARLGAAGPVPDLVFNNAALINRPAPLWEVPADEFDALIDVNVKGVAAVLRHFLPPMIAAGRGVVVNLSSGWGRGTSPEMAPYCASKFAVEALTASLAEELPPGLAAVAVSPGVVHTEMLRVAFGAAGAAQAVDPTAWGEHALDELLALGPRDNGTSITISR